MDRRHPMLGNLPNTEITVNGVDTEAAHAWSSRQSVAQYVTVLCLMVTPEHGPKSQGPTQLFHPQLTVNTAMLKVSFKLSVNSSKYLIVCLLAQEVFDWGT